MSNTTGRPSQFPSGHPDDKQQIPSAPRVPDVVVPSSELEERRKVVRERTDEVFAGRGSESPVRVRKPKVIRLKPRPLAKIREPHRSRPLTKAKDRRSMNLQPFPLQGPTVTSIGNGEVTVEKVAVIERRAKIIARRGQDRIFVLFLKHPAGQDNFSPISLQEATRRLSCIRQQFPFLDSDDEALVFNRVADIVLSFMGDRFPRINDARISSIVKLIYDDATPRKIYDRLEDYSKTQPESTRQGRTPTNRNPL
jgi:hypothetical protein